MYNSLKENNLCLHRSSSLLCNLLAENNKRKKFCFAATLIFEDRFYWPLHATKPRTVILVERKALYNWTSLCLAKKFFSDIWPLLTNSFGKLISQCVN